MRKIDIILLPSTILVLIGLLFGFQNCSEPFDIGESEVSSYNKSLPFAFDTTVDHLAYMSCSNMANGYPTRSYFTFRLGAYLDGSGIRFTDSFKTLTANYTHTERATAVAQSDANAGAILQVALRQYGGYDNLLTASGGNKEGFDYDNILAPLDTINIAAKISELGPNERIHYFSGVPGLEGRVLEGDLRFTQSETLEKEVRNHLEANHILTLNYGNYDSADVRIPLGPEPVTSIYGRGYRLSFGSGHVHNMNGAPTQTYNPGSARRALASVSEVNLLTGQTELASWHCPATATFMIIRPEDIPTDVACSTTGENVNNPDPVYRAIRKVLRYEDWHVDMTRRCVVPKQTSGICYGGGNVKVNYMGNLGGSPNCGPNAQGQYRTITLNNKVYNVLCPHYVTVCVRSQQ